MSIALFDIETPAVGVGDCLCGRPLPKRPPYRPAARHCSYWCSLVENGPAFYTLDSIQPWLLRNRGPISIHSVPEGTEK